MQKLFSLKKICICISIGVPFFTDANAQILSPYPYVPISMQGTVYTKSGESAKPNVLLMIDNSGSMMNSSFGYPKRYYYYFLGKNGSRTISHLGRVPWDRYKSHGAYEKDKNDPYDIGITIDEANKRMHTWNAQKENRSPDRKIYREYIRENKTRLQVVQQSAGAIIGKYGNKARWAVWPLNPIRLDNKIRRQKRSPIGLHLWQDYTSNSQFDRSLNLSNAMMALHNIQYEGATPIIQEYANEMYYYVRDNMAFRCQKNYIIILTDGEDNSAMGAIQANYDLSHILGNRWSNSGSSFRIPSNQKYTFMKDLTSSLATHDILPDDPTSRKWDNANQPFYGKQTIETFAIGFGEEMQGGRGSQFITSVASKPEYAFFALDHNELDSTFAKIFDKFEYGSDIKTNSTVTINEDPVTSSSDNESSNTMIEATLYPSSWSTSLSFYKRNSKGKVDYSSRLAPTYNKRNLLISYLSDGDMQYQFSTSSDVKLNNNFFNITGQDDEWKTSLLPWFSRNGKVKNSNYRTTYPVGDIIDAPITSYQPKFSLNPEEKNYFKKEFNKTKYFVTAANDGLLYIFSNKENAEDKEGSEKEKEKKLHQFDLVLNYLPLSMQRQSNSESDTIAKHLKPITQTGYGSENTNEKQHRLLFNGGISMREAVTVGTNYKQTFLAANLGQGGRGSIAINLAGQDLLSGSKVGLDANQSDWPRTVPIMETEKGAENTLGYTISTPIITRSYFEPYNIQLEKPNRQKNLYYTMIVSNGFDYKNNFITDTSTSAVAALHVYALSDIDVATGVQNLEHPPKGKLIAKIVAPESQGGLADPVAFDTDMDEIPDVVYAGDAGGNMYRFDLRGGKPEAWYATKIFQGNQKKPITSAPAVIRQSNKAEDNGKVIVIFGTGSELYQKDYGNQGISQSLYGIYDDINAKEETPDIDDSEGASGIKDDTSSGITDNEASHNIDKENTANNKPQKTKEPKVILSDHSPKNILLQQPFSTDLIRISEDKAIDRTTHLGWRVDFDNIEKNYGERVVIQPMTVNSTVIVRTKYFTTNNTTSLDPCAQSSYKFNYVTKGSVLAFDAFNGGLPKKSSATLVFPGYEGRNINGIRYNEYYSFVYVYTINYDPFKSFDNHGALRSIGYDSLPDDNPNIRKKAALRCSSSGESLNSSQTTIGVTLPPCPYKTINRLSWKEID